MRCSGLPWVSNATWGRASGGSCRTVAAARTEPWLCPEITTGPCAASAVTRRASSGTARAA